MIAVYTLVSEDGVIGLNGRRYLEDDDGEIQVFNSIEEARTFIEEHGEDPDNEYIEYEDNEDGSDPYENDPMMDSIAKEIVRERNNA